VKDWPHHLSQIADFWSSVMLASGRYQGRPMMKHLIHAERITPEMFDRWLALWARTTDEMLPPAAAMAMQERAHRIAESLKAGVMRHDVAPQV
jgi:hemoglobin